ncbi:TROVE domain-containing protein [Tellurirhabdus bombi]|uniref:TROVE domain-containing protein n=1 Tax=Tellurirhabdus bombi TaxID=2907205 RepID=UPI001F316156|nr:TROVE domain-containing protein [Tellurirhabdus bombi]
MKFSTYFKTRTVNHERAGAFRLTPELELYSAVASTMLNATFYEQADERMNRIRELVGKVSPAFVAKLAVYVREKMYLRSAPVVLASELAKVHNGDNLVSKTVNRVVQRPDEILELLAYYQMANERKEVKRLNRLSKQVQKGLSAAFNKFDEYQFAKYNRAATVKLRDALFLVHPKAKDEEQQVIFNKIVSDSLETPYTWETELSALGQVKFPSPAKKAEAFRQKWEELVSSQRMGYMATLRNLRNLLEAGVNTETLRQVCAYLANEKAVQKSKQLPFRFLAAYREIKGVRLPARFIAVAGQGIEDIHRQPVYAPVVLNALEKAIQMSMANLRGFDADKQVVIACDVSGSMQSPVSARSKVLLYDIGLLLGMLLQSKCKNVLSGMFGDRWQPVSLSSDNVLENVEAFYRREGEVGYSTNGYLVLEDLICRRHVADKVMFFTDMQLWDSQTYNQSVNNTLSAKWRQYKEIAPNAKLYLFDLAGHGQAPLRTEQDDVFLIAGWSDKIFDVLQALEEGQDALSHIAQIEL